MELYLYAPVCMHGMLRRELLTDTENPLYCGISHKDGGICQEGSCRCKWLQPPSIYDNSRSMTFLTTHVVLSWDHTYRSFITNNCQSSDLCNHTIKAGMKILQMNSVNETFIKQEYLFYVTNYAKNKITYHRLLL